MPRTEIVGWGEEIVGGPDDEIGADYDALATVGDDGRGQSRVYERGQPAAYRRDPRGPRMRQRDPDASRQFPVGFMANVPQGHTVSIEAKPQVLFRGERLAVAPSCANEFSIVDIKVGAQSQLAADGEMTAEAFSASAVGTRMELDTAQPGIVITLVVKHLGPPQPAAGLEPRPFRAVLYGTVLK